MHLVGITQSVGLFLVVCFATAAALSLAIAGLARIERATVAPSRRSVPRPPSSERDPVAGPGTCSYGPPSL